MTTMRNLKAFELFQGVHISSATTVQGTGQDLADTIHVLGRQMKAILSANHIGGTTPTLDVKLQESDSLATGYSDITGAAFAQVTTTDSLQELHFRITKRYVRAEYTSGGTSPEYAMACLLIAEKRQAP